MSAGTALPYQLSKQLVGTNQEHFLDGIALCWYATSNATFNIVHGAGYQMSAPTKATVGGSYIVTGEATTGAQSGSINAWNLSLQNFSANQQMVTWSTTMSSFPGTSGTAVVIWTIGFGSLDTVYPVFNWSILGTYLMKEIQYNRAGQGISRFCGVVGARLFSEFTQNMGVAATFVTASLVSQTTGGTLATIIVQGDSPGLNSPGYAVLYGSIGGTTGLIGQDPIATFRKYLNDPIGINDDGGGWLSVGAGTSWTATFLLDIKL